MQLFTSQSHVADYWNGLSAIRTRILTATHSLQRIPWWANDVKLNWSKSVLMKKKKKRMAWGRVTFSAAFHFWVNYSLMIFDRPKCYSIHLLFCEYRLCTKLKPLRRIRSLQLCVRRLKAKIWWQYGAAPEARSTQYGIFLHELPATWPSLQPELHMFTHRKLCSYQCSHWLR